MEQELLQSHKFLTDAEAKTGEPADWKKKDADVAILLVTFLGWLRDLLKGLSDLELGDKMVTLNHLGVVVSNMGVSKNRGIYPKMDFVYNGICLFFNG